MKKPIIDSSCFIAETAVILGDVTIGTDSSVWYHVTIRGDREPIKIGVGTNIQDNAVLHVGAGNDLVLGNYVTVGHGAVVHGCHIGDYTLVGMGAIIMNGAKIGKNCIIGAGSLISEGKEIPDNSLVVGVPGRIIRNLTEEDLRDSMQNARLYIEEAQEAKNTKEEENV
ncbi:MAG: gamma carbonic anhydrase family protein [Lachnospiraceae bacterium]|nr:gamma carbonic anhydrase family protein [Lachnospiraceae bacterium]